jgi:hypothetical protein
MSYKSFTLPVSEANACVAIPNACRRLVRELSYSVITTLMDQKQHLLKPLNTREMYSTSIQLTRTLTCAIIHMQILWTTRFESKFIGDDFLQHHCPCSFSFVVSFPTFKILLSPKLVSYSGENICG